MNARTDFSRSEHDRIDAHRRVLLPAPDEFGAWREEARRLIAEGVRPELVEWHVADGRQNDLFAPERADAPHMALSEGRASASPVTIDRRLLSLLKTALLHRDPGRFALGYRIVWRAQADRLLGRKSSDADIARLSELAKSVRRDIHKMHAFVRFRKVGERTADDDAARDIFVAWFEPDHHITRAVGPFFRDRFTGMDWTIVTPEARISWDGSHLSHGAGGQKSDVPADDAIEAEWRRYYSSIFNPARVKPGAMKSEMPVKYWKNLPEAELISPLMREANARVREMTKERQNMMSELALDGPERAPSGKPAGFSSLADLNDWAGAHDERPSGLYSQRLVFGEGPQDARFMIVGEQPGDREDEEGRPFVGPAGELLSRAMREAGIDRKQVYVTNAVKRFKFEQRGKRRIHQSPTQGEISHYRWWLKEEIGLVAPRVLVPLGASAILALLGRREKLSAIAGEPLALQDGQVMLAAYHPSYILRMPDEGGREVEYGKLVRHLTRAKEAAAA